MAFSFEVFMLSLRWDVLWNAYDVKVKAISKMDGGDMKSLLETSLLTFLALHCIFWSKLILSGSKNIHNSVSTFCLGQPLFRPFLIK